MPVILYDGPEEKTTLCVTDPFLEFEHGVPVEVNDAIWDLLKNLTNNKGEVYGYWKLADDQPTQEVSDDSLEPVAKKRTRAKKEI